MGMELITEMEIDAVREWFCAGRLVDALGNHASQPYLQMLHSVIGTTMGQHDDIIKVLIREIRGEAGRLLGII